MNNVRNYNIILILAAILLCCSCNKKFSSSLFKKQSPHEAYEQKLKDAGLEGTTVFNKWVNASARSLSQPLPIKVPYREKAFFAGESPEASGFIFEAVQGEQLNVKLTLQSADSSRLFIDLFEAVPDTSRQHKYLYSAEPGATSLVYNIDNNGKYILRIQPELLSALSYELQITADPSLGNPVTQSSRNSIGSFYGDGRDAGNRKHEGIDIFAERNTPALAAADGIISNVGINKLGGKVVFLRPKGRSINLYYAHLDSQLVSVGQSVSLGDTIGLIGNTGNAISTPPHLHFGIYTSGGAIDPLPFVRSNKTRPPNIISDDDRIGDTVRIRTESKKYALNSPGVIEAAALNGYRVIFPDKSKTFVLQNEILPVIRPLRTITLNESKLLYYEPNLMAAVIKGYDPGTKLSILGDYNGFYLIEKDDKRGWIKQ